MSEGLQAFLTVSNNASQVRTVPSKLSATTNSIAVITMISLGIILLMIILVFVA